MCGIIGYIGKKEAVPILIDGLHKLEYRGYDSAGICVLNENSLNSIKNKGKINELEKRNELFGLKGQVGIAHTRWATHGEPNEKNSHPHFDCKREIAVVHNGIVENFHSLKEMLEKEGHVFASDTDSEVIAHLIEKFYNGNLEGAVMRALKLVEGTFGLAVLHNCEKRIIAARKGSPLILGVGENELFVCSDVSAILKYTNRVIYLKDNEIINLDFDNYCIKNLDGDNVPNNIEEIKIKAEQIEKGEFKHFMLKEIFEQPVSIENTFRGRIKGEEIKLSVEDKITYAQRIIIIACGTSWHSALIGKYLIEKLVKIPVEVDYASEFRYREPLINNNDLVIFISQSGETADTLAALQEAKLRGAKTLGIVNVVGSTISREVDSGIFLHAGPEIGVASTKAFTCQVVALILFALYLKYKREGKIDLELLNEINKLPIYVEEILKKNSEIREIAEKYKESRNFLYLGRGLNFPVALEGALKLKEISYIHAEGYPAAEMKHGPIALVDENMPVVFIAPHDSSYDKIISNMQEIKARKGKIIAIVNEVDENIKKLADEIIKVPHVIDELSPIVNAIPLQLLAYHIADLKGIDVDKPKNLAKSVTVE